MSNRAKAETISTVQRWTRFAAAIAVVSVVWLLILPWIGSHESMRARVNELDQQGIDPAALFYTDLDAMQRLESNLAAIKRENREVFWQSTP